MDEDVLVGCFQHAIQSHHHTDSISPWKVPTVNVFKDWEPKVLHLSDDNDGKQAAAEPRTTPPQEQESAPSAPAADLGSQKQTSDETEGK